MKGADGAYQASKICASSEPVSFLWRTFSNCFVARAKSNSLRFRCPEAVQMKGVGENREDGRREGKEKNSAKKEGVCPFQFFRRSNKSLPRKFANPFQLMTTWSMPQLQSAAETQRTLSMPAWSRSLTTNTRRPTSRTSSFAIGR